jgi:NAD(P)-dependent dehydrogenase (short-subunit alcohol dehydrogenase family)
MNICITGSNGKLGSKLVEICEINKFNVIKHEGKKTGNLLDENHVSDFFDSIPMLDCLICCAGGKKEDSGYSLMQEMIANNLYCTYLTCEKCIPKMKNKSTILTIGSVAGCFGQKDGSSYATAKAALHIYSRCLAKQLLEKNISVNCLAVGTITNDNITDIANSILMFKSYSSINGQVIRIDNAHHTFAC